MKAPRVEELVPSRWFRLWWAKDAYIEGDHSTMRVAINSRISAVNARMQTLKDEKTALMQFLRDWRF